jgi:pilus assembly protein Flp/PilA
MKALIHFLRDTKGTTSIEYALIASLVSIGIIVGATSVGTGTNEMYNTLETQVRPKL